jgi:hypothetical protein
MSNKNFERIFDPIMMVVTWIAGIVAFYWIFLRWVVAWCVQHT